MKIIKPFLNLLTNDDYDRVVAHPAPKILAPNEKFVLENKAYINADQSIILTSTFATGKLFQRRRTTTDSDAKKELERAIHNVDGGHDPQSTDTQAALS